MGVSVSALGAAAVTAGGALAIADADATGVLGTGFGVELHAATTARVTIDSGHKRLWFMALSQLVARGDPFDLKRKPID